MILSASNFLDLVKSNKKLSECKLPELIHKLIRQSLNGNTYTHFPSGDDVFTPGWDGYIENNSIDHRFLPLGKIFVEVGANTDWYKGIRKIKSDYNKRKCEDIGIDKSDYSYIAITASILNSTSKQVFCEKSNNEKIFRKVIILDAIDISSWLDEHINICIWFLKEYGKKIDDYGITLLDDEWENIASVTTPHLSYNIFKIGNESFAQKLIDDFETIKNNRIITISSPYYGRDYAYDFCIATLRSMANQDIQDRVIIVNSQAALNYVGTFCEEKIVLVNFNCFDERFASFQKNTYIFFDTLFNDDFQLNPVTQKDFQNEIEKIGFSNSEAHKISFIVGNNVLALRRLLATNPLIKMPLWCRDKYKNELIPLLLMGELKMDEKGDLDFAKALVGDDLDNYTEKLNIWTERSESPILKYGNIYRISSRRECFDFIQVDVFSGKVERLEKQLLIALSEINFKYKDIKRNWLFNDGSYIWRDELIINILNGFIILSEKNKRVQIHFDAFTEQIFDKLQENYELSLTVAHLFYKIAELSPSSFLRYLRIAIKDDNSTLIKVCNTLLGGFFRNGTFSTYILSALENVIKIERYALEAFELLLDLYYSIDSNDNILNEVIKMLSPISSKCGVIAMPLHQKTTFFFNYIKEKDYFKTKRIIEKIFLDESDYIMVAVHDSYRLDIPQKNGISNTEIYEMRDCIFKWMMEHSGADENTNMVILRGLLRGIHREFFETQKERFNEFIVKNKTQDDCAKAEICYTILETRENILKFKDWDNLKGYIPLFDEMIAQLTPNDEYLKNRYIFVKDDFPLLDPCCSGDPDWYEKSSKQRKKIREKCLVDLVGKYGHKIIEKIINDCSKSSYSIWSLLYSHSDNRFADIKIMLERALENGLRVYLELMPFNDVVDVIKTYNNDEMIIKNLPCNKQVYEFVFGKDYEEKYWISHNFEYEDKEMFEIAFEKFIRFAPNNLLGDFAYLVDSDYSHEIKLLSALSSWVNGDKKLSEHEIFALNELVRKMDQKYYTEELSFCEFKLLPFIKREIGDYPMGIKKYIWDNPEELGKLLIQLNKQKDSLAPESLGQRIIFEAYCAFGGACYIPKDYMIAHRDVLKQWVLGVLKPCENEDAVVKRLVKSAIINTLACCPKNDNELVWPITEIADILEYLSYEDYDDKYRVSSNFYCGYVNRRGIRSVGDGSVELTLSEKFRQYKNYYQYSHPVVSRALDYIAENYNGESEMDRMQAYLGFNLV